MLVSIVGIPTSLMIADPLTKALAPKDYKEHVRNMGLIDLLYYLGHHYSNGFTILILSNIHMY